LILTREELDNPHKPKTWDVFRESLKVELRFDPVEEEGFRYSTNAHSASAPGTQGRVDTRRVVSLLRSVQEVKCIFLVL